jgi:hypothetical protein
MKLKPQRVILFILLLRFRTRNLHTASNRLLISLLVSDFALLLNCYIAVYQSLKGFPVFGVLGMK